MIEADNTYHVDFTSSDGTYISIDAQETTVFSALSIFDTLENVSAFLEKGAVGYSPNGKGFDGLRLATYTWKVTPLAVSAVHSSFFENEALFPNGSVKFDNALLMTATEHEWHGVASK